MRSCLCLLMFLTISAWSTTSSAQLALTVPDSFSGQIVAGTRDRYLLNESYGFADRAAGEPVTTATLFDIGSLTKQFTAAGILWLVQTGELSLDEPLSEFFDDISRPLADRTVRQLLTHTAGLPQYSGDDYELVDRGAFEDWLSQTDETIEEAGNFSYSNPGYSVLARIIEIRSGQDYESFLRENLLVRTDAGVIGYTAPSGPPEAVGYLGGKALGRPSEQAWLSDGPSWNLRGNGGILASAESLYNWVRSLSGGDVLDATHTVMLFRPYVIRDEESGRHYGFGWDIEGSGQNRRIFHSGGNLVFVAFAEWWPETDCFFVVTSNAYDESGISELIGEIRAQLSSQPECAVAPS